MNIAASRFNNLTMEEKCSLVNHYGHWLWFTDHNGYRVNLYEIEGQFIEVWYDIYSRSLWRIRMPDYQEMDLHLHCIQLKYETE